MAGKGIVDVSDQGPASVLRMERESNHKGEEKRRGETGTSRRVRTQSRSRGAGETTEGQQ